MAQDDKRDLDELLADYNQARKEYEEANAYDDGPVYRLLDAAEAVVSWAEDMNALAKIKVAEGF